MGMDLVSINNETTFSVNWFGYQNFVGLLQQLGCDVSEAKFVNDGGIIKEETCKAWSLAVIENLVLGKIKNLYVVDKNYQDGGYNKLVFVDSDKNNTNLTALLQENITSLISFCDFLNDCNGCRQC